MDFFGLNSTLPRDRGHESRAPGFGAPHDAFGAPPPRDLGDDDVIDFEDTYEGLGSRLDDTADDLNDDTFGAEPATQQKIGRDFDFSGTTGDVSQAIEEERMRWAAQHAPSRISPQKQTTKPLRSGYEGIIPQLEADATLWGITSKEPEPPKQAPAARKALTLEEVEAMLAQSKKTVPPQPTRHEQFQNQVPLPFPTSQQQQFQQPVRPSPPPAGYNHPPQILQRPQQPPGQQQQHVHPQAGPKPQQSHEAPSYGAQRTPQILQRQKQPPQAENAGPRPSSSARQNQQRQQQQAQPQQPRQILQNPNRLSGHGQPLAPQSQPQPQQPGHGRGPSYSGPIITNPQQILHLSEEDRAAFLHEEAKRAKRNHKIAVLSKDNGLMTPQDKNFITRIQLQQLVTATGSVDAQGPESLLSEDFYYQVYAQIRGAPRQNPHQPANQFAQTYLFQTGGRYGGRRHPRGGDNHIQRMEQQVQRAVEAARAKPKNKQLVIEGSLGKISFSNAKTPKPLLNIKRSEGDSRPNVSARRVRGSHDAAAERRATLRDIENVYNSLMSMEDHERKMPPPPNPGSSQEEIDLHMEWEKELKEYNQKLWRALKVHEPIIPNSPTLHPFIAILSHPKGKKAVPRLFRHIDDQQRVTILTMIVVQLDTLDVIANALVNPVPTQVKEDVDLFVNAVMPALFAHVNESPLPVILGLIGLILERTDVKSVVRTKVGLGILTMLISRAELLKESASQQPQDAQSWQQYTTLYNALFTTLEPGLPLIFPDANPLATDDVHVWQFLAAMGVAANAEQQQRLVIGVKERVMGAVGAARTLPTGEKERRLGEVNLFMRALGLDVELLA